MPEPDRLLGMYLHLARASKWRQQPLVRAKLLVLAGVQAEEMGLPEISALCRQKILSHNARHLVRRWPTLGEALASEPFQEYLQRLKRRYSGEKIEHMLHSLGIEMGQERAAYFSDLEYAAALLDTRPERLAAQLAAGARPAAATSPAPAESPAVERRPRVRDLAIVWGPFVAGLVAVGILALGEWRLS